MSKGAGVVYNGASKHGSMPPGSNLRRIITMHPEWLEYAAMLHKMIMLKMTE